MQMLFLLAVLALILPAPTSPFHTPLPPPRPSTSLAALRSPIPSSQTLQTTSLLTSIHSTPPIAPDLLSNKLQSLIISSPLTLLTDSNLLDSTWHLLLPPSLAPRPSTQTVTFDLESTQRSYPCVTFSSFLRKRAYPVVSLTRSSVYLEGKGEVRVSYVDSRLLVLDGPGGRWVYGKERVKRSRRVYVLSLFLRPFRWVSGTFQGEEDVEDVLRPVDDGLTEAESFGIGEAFIEEGVGRDTDYDGSEEMGRRGVGEFEKEK